MASLKETPRQKMIGILYLVLLGLIATNISSSVLDAFRYLTASLVTSTKNVQSNTDNTYAAFEATKLKSEPDRARPIYDKAKQASKYFAELDGYIGEIKGLMEDKGGGYNAEGDLRKRDNVDISPRLMINQGRGVELKKKINDTKAKVFALLSEQDKAGLTFSLNADDPPSKAGISKTWEQSNFGDGIPLTAALTALTKIRADEKNTEYDVVRKILGHMDQAVVNLDQFAAVAVAPSSYVILGQPYTAQVFLTASDSKASSDVFVNGTQLPLKDGRGEYSVNTSKEGSFSWSGIIKVHQTDGTVKEYNTGEQRYQVARPSAVVSADKMNVFYIGVANPISVSAPGIAKENLKVSLSGGSISGSAGAYSVHVSTPGNTNVVVSTEVGGKTQVLSSTPFRIKRIPDPKVKFGGKSGGRLSSVAMKSQNRIFAMLDNFDFDAKFNIERFTLIIVKPRAEAVVLQANGNVFSGAMQSAMSSITPGTRVIFDNIIATGPDGMKRQLDPLTLTAE
ncbi:MAG: gliding motility protein GldM [Flavipsychrobacter sp.]|nr:gliding motility protein GldM [Flavipsychrobacter sp.]